MSNVAKQVIIPATPDVFRSIFLFTGQGDATLHVIPNNGKYVFVLLDCDQDKDPGEINLIAMLKDLFAGTGRGIDVYINTHPHNDHIGGIKEIYEEVGIDEVWHSNHKPGKDHKRKYEDLYHVIKSVGKDKEFHLKGTNKLNKVRNVSNQGVIKPLGDVAYQILSPSEFLCDEIDEATANERDRRIHHQCGVIKFSYGDDPKNILMTGDSDVKTWRENIMYYENVLKSLVLHASHHGSDTFFIEGKEPAYFSHIDAIAPDYVVVSAPKTGESSYGHPDDFAMKTYKKYAGDNNVCNLGDKPCSVIVDINKDGSFSISKDSRLIDAYSENGDGDGGASTPPIGFTKRDEVSNPQKRERFA